MPPPRSGWFPLLWRHTQFLRKAPLRFCGPTCLERLMISLGVWLTRVSPNLTYLAWCIHEKRKAARVGVSARRRTRHALLATQPCTHSKTASKHRRRGNHAPANLGAPFPHLLSKALHGGNE